MPPGVDERQNGGISPFHEVFQERFNQRYLKLVRRYSDIIVGQFFGHLHSDSFRIIYSDTGKICRSTNGAPFVSSICNIPICQLPSPADLATNKTAFTAHLIGNWLHSSVAVAVMRRISKLAPNVNRNPILSAFSVSVLTRLLTFLNIINL